MKNKENRGTFKELWNDWSEFSSKHPIVSEWMFLGWLLFVVMYGLAEITGKQWDLV